MSDHTSEHPDFVMEIEIDTLLGTSFDMTVSSIDTIRQLKVRIHRVQGIPTHQQNLIYNSKELKDSHRLCDAGVCNGATLQLITSMRGGPISTRRALGVDHQALFRELRDLVDSTREEVEEKKLNLGSKVSVLVFKEGDVLNLLRVIENEDGTYSPYTGKAVAPPIKPTKEKDVINPEDSLYVPMEKTEEHQDMRQKVHILQKKMKHLENKRLARASSEIALPAIMSKEELFAHFSHRKANTEKCGFEVENEEIALKDKHRIKPSVSDEQARLELYQPKRQPFSMHETEPLESNANSLYDESLLPEYESDSETFSISPLKNLHIRSAGGIGIRSEGHRWGYDDEKPVEVCAGDLCHGQFVTSPSAIPPQYAPKDEGLCNYYYKNRAPLYRRQCLEHYEQKGDESGGREDDMYRICEKYPEVEKNYLECSNAIRKLSDEGFGKDGDDVGGGIADLPRKIGAFNFYDLYSTYYCNLAFIPPAKAVAGEKEELVKISSEKVQLPPVVAKKKSRCNECSKRLNITNIYHCRCGKIFCSQHRYSEVHRCDYDYKSEGRKILEIQNPMVMADKITRI